MKPKHVIHTTAERSEKLIIGENPWRKTSVQLMVQEQQKGVNLQSQPHITIKNNFMFIL